MFANLRSHPRFMQILKREMSILSPLDLLLEIKPSDRATFIAVAALLALIALGALARLAKDAKPVRQQYNWKHDSGV